MFARIGLNRSASRWLPCLLAGTILLASNAHAAENAKQEVHIDNFTFSPVTLSVKPGTTVTWLNRDDIPHTVVSSAGPLVFKSHALDTDQSFDFTFATPGTYTYFCSLHPHMQGTIVVSNGS